MSNLDESNQVLRLLTERLTAAEKERDEARAERGVLAADCDQMERVLRSREEPTLRILSALAPTEENVEAYLKACRTGFTEGEVRRLLAAIRERAGRAEAGVAIETPSQKT